MKLEKKINKETESTNIVNKEFELKVYIEPKITKLGAMQRVTLGGSIGVGDSGSGDFSEKPDGPGV